MVSVTRSNQTAECGGWIEILDEGGAKRPAVPGPMSSLGTATRSAYSVVLPCGVPTYLVIPLSGSWWVRAAYGYNYGRPV